MTDRILKCLIKYAPCTPKDVGIYLGYSNDYAHSAAKPYLRELVKSGLVERIKVKGWTKYKIK